eukprot:scaffold24493_cov61-Phaeocystis_antarctica.AAC.1
MRGEASEVHSEGREGRREHDAGLVRTEESGAAGCSGGASHRLAERLRDHLARALGQAVVHHRVGRAAGEEHRHRAVGGVHAAGEVLPVRRPATDGDDARQAARVGEPSGEGGGATLAEAADEDLVGWRALRLDLLEHCMHRGHCGVEVRSGLGLREVDRE